MHKNMRDALFTTYDSLVDASVVPFQKAYLLLWIMMYLILAGNTAFPIFLRFIM